MQRTQSKQKWLESLYIEYYATLYKIARYELSISVGSAKDAADLVHDVFLIAAREQDKLRTHPNLRGWLVKTLYNICRNYGRAGCNKNEKILKSEMENPSLELKAVKRGRDDLAVGEVLLSLEQMLNTQDYQILKAYCLENRDAEEICEEMNITITSLRVRIHRLRKNILKFFHSV